MALKKMDDLVIYRDDAWYSTFPSLVTRPDGSVLCAFRRAPDRRRWGGAVTHSDPNSWCMSVRSTDNGKTWTGEPQVIFAHPLAGNQDPCLLQLADGTILCSTFSWMLLPDGAAGKPGARSAGMGWTMCNLGASVARSTDGGQTWQTPDPFAAAGDVPAGHEALVGRTVEEYVGRCDLSREQLTEAARLGLQRAAARFDGARGAPFAQYAEWWVRQSITRAIAQGQPHGSLQPISPPGDMPPERFAGVVNRGACRGKMTQLPDGRVLWPLYAFAGDDAPTASRVYVSADGGQTWQYLSLIAQDSTVHFNETSLQLCPSGRIVAWMRTADLDGYLAMAYSTDGGETWSAWRQTSVWGHPFTSCELPDGRVALTYGYRREPFGIRMRLLEPECGDLEQAQELTVRDDGANSDVGYPWVTPLADGNILCAYYINTDGGPRYIAGSIVCAG